MRRGAGKGLIAQGINVAVMEVGRCRWEGGGRRWGGVHERLGEEALRKLSAFFSRT